MNCPTCGLRILPDQKFCRSCGDSLQVITRPLVMDAGVSAPERTGAVISRVTLQQANKLMLWGFIIMFVGVAIGVIGKKFLHDEFVTVVGILAALAGMFLTVYPYLSPPRREREGSESPAPPEVLLRAQPQKYLPRESNIEYVPSITERTTNLLKNSAAARPERKEDEETPF